MNRARSCGLFVAAGTSLVVGPINQMFDCARAAGARTAIMAASNTPYDGESDWKLSEPVEELLPELASRILGET
jgi:NAD-dependent SIR2 family protein deacetylase